MEISGNPSDVAQLVPKRAIIFHMGREGGVATEHVIQPDPSTGAPTLGAGSPLDRQAIKAMVADLADIGRTEPDILPACVLVAETDMMVWWRPAQKRQIFFATSDKEFNDAVSGKEVWHPPLLFIAMPHIQDGSSSRLYAYALGGDGTTRPDANSVLKRAPYMNLYETGLLCPGDAPLPYHPAVRNLLDWERGFFEYSFVHHIPGNETVVAHPKGHRGYWLDLADSLEPRAISSVVSFFSGCLIAQKPIGDEAVATLGGTVKKLWKKQ